MKTNLFLIALFVLVALPAAALPDGQWTYDYYDESGNLVGRKDIWCGGIQTTGTVTTRFCVLYWGPCETMEPWLGCDSEGWSDKPGNCGQCMSASYEDSYNYCITTDCNGNKKPGCP